MDKTEEFALHRRLKELSPLLHRNYMDASLSACLMLDRYQTVFPQYTDHSSLHCLNIMELSGRIIGGNLHILNGSELYVLLTGILFHDLGMGISERDLKELAPMVSRTVTWGDTGAGALADFIREFHQEFSALLIQKYSGIFEISEEYLFPVMQAVRGHRKTNLWDEHEFPAFVRTGDEDVCLPYIAGIIRLADEMDLCRDRNSILDKTGESISDPYSSLVWKTHDTVKKLVLTEEECLLYVDSTEHENSGTRRELEKWKTKLQRVMDEVQDVIKRRTPYRLPARRVTIVETDI